MNPTTPPPNPDEHEPRSLFEEFINRNLDLDGLDEDDHAEGEEIPSPDEAARILFQLQFPGGGPVLQGALSGAPGSAESGRLPPMPLSQDVRWQSVAMLGHPSRLRVYRPRIEWEAHAGQLVVTLGARAGRMLQIIPDVRPGWTAVRYRATRNTLGELIEWRGNKAALHHLRLDHKEISGFIKREDMPPFKPVRVFRLVPRVVDLMVILLIVTVLVFSLSLIVDRLPLGEGPTVVEMQDRIDALQEQVRSLEAQLDASAAQGGQ